MNAYDIIRRPVITEQSMESVADKKYVFMGDVNANKTEIKAANEEMSGVKVAKVNPVRIQGSGDGRQKACERARGICDPFLLLCGDPVHCGTYGTCGTGE